MIETQKLTKREALVWCQDQLDAERARIRGRLEAGEVVFTCGGCRLPYATLRTVAQSAACPRCNLTDGRFTRPL